MTLACDDGHFIKAHKVILSSASSTFKTILTQNPHSHPLLYLKGMKQRHLQSLINFIYLGETEIAQDDLEDFMETAVELRINGLQYLNQTTQRENNEDAIDVQSSYPEPDEGLFVSLPACTLKNEKIENDIEPTMMGDIPDELARKFSFDQCDYQTNH